MAIRHLRVASADQNPIVTHSLPASRPTLEFPITTESSEQQRERITKTFFAMLACSFACLLFCGFAVALGPETCFLLIVGGLVLLAIRAHLRSPEEARRWCIIAVIPISIAAVIFLRTISVPLLLGVSVVFLLFEGYMVSLHYTHWSTTGFMSRTRAKRIREGRLQEEDFRPGPLFVGITNAIGSYLSYNPSHITLPGTWQSPAGSYLTRLVRLFALIVFLTFSTAFTFGSPFFFLGQYFFALGPWNFLTLPLVALSLWLLSAGVCSGASLAGSHGLAAARFSPDYWPEFIEERVNSSDPVERESIFLSTVEHDGSPVLNPVDQFLKHAWIVGKTGSGKTTYLLGIIDQLVRREDISVDYLDLKATSFEPLAVLQGGVPGTSSPPVREVKFFTLENGMPSYLFDLFTQPAWLNLPTAQRAALILSSLSLSYSPAYGQSWYRDAAYDVVHFVLRRHPQIKNWAEFAKRIQDAIRYAKPWELSDAVKHDGVHVELILKRLAALSALNATEEHSEEIRTHALDLSEGFLTPSHTYLALSTSTNGLIAGEIGRLYATSLLISAATTKNRSVRRILVIDEWQCMVTNELTLLLEQARSLGIGVILANQTTAQLVTPDGDLRAIVEGNTSLQAWLQITDGIGREQLRGLGGQEIDYISSVTTNHEGNRSHTRSECITDRVPPTYTSSVGSEQQRYFLRLTDNAGYACYGDLAFVANSHFHQNQKHYQAYCKMPWPAPTPMTLINKEPPHDPPAPPATGVPAPVPNPPDRDSPKAGRPKTNQLGRTRSRKASPTKASP